MGVRRDDGDDVTMGYRFGLDMVVDDNCLVYAKPSWPNRWLVANRHGGGLTKPLPPYCHLTNPPPPNCHHQTASTKPSSPNRHHQPNRHQVSKWEE
nr:hypothetical protein [Tanacetum cinerariifolium]